MILIRVHGISEFINRDICAILKLINNHPLGYSGNSDPLVTTFFLTDANPGDFAAVGNTQSVCIAIDRSAVGAEPGIRSFGDTREIKR